MKTHEGNCEFVQKYGDNGKMKETGKAANDM